MGLVDAPEGPRSLRALERLTFPTEASLAGPVEDWLMSLRATCVAHEVDAGFGIPDLMAGFGDTSRLRRRWKQSPPIQDSLQLRLLEYCRTARTEAELRAWAPNGFSDLKRRAVVPLLKHGLIESVNDGLKTRTLPKDPFRHLVAVELKLADARRGLRQAHSYRAFSDISYLAMPASRINATILDAARRHFVGLLAVHAGAVEEVVEPPSGTVFARTRRRIASERILAAAADPSRPVGGSPKR
jgi:hypothetical protein